MPKAPRRWRLMHAPAASGAENMARDAALMDHARNTGEHVFSVYSWTRPTLSLGRNQTARGRYDLDEAARREIDIVRRPTGGRALLHWREVTYSVAASSEDDSLRESYEQINAIVLYGLRKLGVDAAEAQGGPRTPSPGDLPCFAAPAEGELVTNGSKLVGSAQVRENGALLQHGSILIRDDQSLIADLLREKSSAAEVPRAATLADAMGREPTLDEVARALFESVKALEDADATAMDAAEVQDLTEKHLEQFQNPLWTWRK
ncbi:MAG TPA: lipoate--protein ligase family protein [Gemmatimonadaceae bacterium]